jgi:hypothetical protein
MATPGANVYLGNRVVRHISDLEAGKHLRATLEKNRSRLRDRRTRCTPEIGQSPSPFSRTHRVDEKSSGLPRRQSFPTTNGNPPLRGAEALNPHRAAYFPSMIARRACSKIGPGADATIAAALDGIDLPTWSAGCADPIIAFPVALRLNSGRTVLDPTAGRSKSKGYSYIRLGHVGPSVCRLYGDNKIGCRI